MVSWAKLGARQVPFLEVWSHLSREADVSAAFLTLICTCSKSHLARPCVRLAYRGTVTLGHLIKGDGFQKLGFCGLKEISNHLENPRHLILGLLVLLLSPSHSPAISLAPSSLTFAGNCRTDMWFRCVNSRAPWSYVFAGWCCPFAGHQPKLFSLFFLWCWKSVQWGSVQSPLSTWT